MQLEDILTLERCYCDVEGVSKKRLIKTVSEWLEHDVKYLSANQIFDALMARERLGSTGLGGGIAIPHCRVSSCQEIFGCLVTLEEGIDFDAVDSNPVDLVFFLIVPEQENDEHIAILSQIASLFADENFCYIIRNTHDREDLYNVAITY